eukprot:11166629-Lingulodinium_polyedra.AAC.1
MCPSPPREAVPASRGPLTSPLRLCFVVVRASSYWGPSVPVPGFVGIDFSTRRRRRGGRGAVQRRPGLAPEVRGRPRG